MKRNKSLRPGISILMGMLLCVVLAACGGGGGSTTTTGSSCGSPPALAKKGHYRVGFS